MAAETEDPARDSAAAKLSALEEKYRAEYHAFGLATRDRWNEIARDETIPPGRKAEALQEWLAGRQAEAERINAMAAELDRLAPVVAPDAPPAKAGEGPAAELSYQLRLLDYRYRKGELDEEEFLRLRGQWIETLKVELPDRRSESDAATLSKLEALRDLQRRFLAGELDEAEHARQRGRILLELRGNADLANP